MTHWSVFRPLTSVNTFSRTALSFLLESRMGKRLSNWMFDRQGWVEIALGLIFAAMLLGSAMAASFR